ncbi:MAG: SDR family oxidoreductase [Candidatus Aminicenantes bacterium]|nr:SDR family oxidoreductase [Candidatus Aminicenantes bacterium]
MGILDSFSLQGKVALVTGGAGRHAPAFIQGLAEAGATVYGGDLRVDRMRTVADTLAERGLAVIPVPLDQGDEQSIRDLKTAILDRDGGLDVLVNAAVDRSMGDWTDNPMRFSGSMQVNATGLFSVTRTFGDVMAERGGGSIVNVASIHGRIGPDRSLYQGLDRSPFVPDYFFHKGGMINFTRFVASYYGPAKVRCNCVSPGGIRILPVTDEFVRRYSARTMLNRMAEARDVAAAILYLASDASSYVTGANLVVDGGYTAM